MAFVEDLRRKAREQGAPVTIGLIVALGAMSLFFYFLHMRFFENLVLSPSWGSQPWTLLTYPFAYPGLMGIGLIWMLITAWWLFWVGASVERDVGSPKFAAFWFLTTLLAGVLMVLAGLDGRLGRAQSARADPVLGRDPSQRQGAYVDHDRARVLRVRLSQPGDRFAYDRAYGDRLHVCREQASWALVQQAGI
jgi:hypothetical protein